MRLSLPSPAKSGAASQNAATTSATPPRASASCPHVASRMRRSSATTSINAMPTGMAAARHPLLISSAGVTMKRSSAAYSTAGASTSAMNATDAAMAMTSSSARVAGAHPLTSAVMRMCSPRRSATTAPSIDKPQEEDRCELVGPHERLMEHVARHHARKKHGDLHDHQQRRHELHRATKRAVDGMRQRATRRGGRRGRCGAHHGHRQASLPTACSSRPHASSPKRFFQSA